MKHFGYLILTIFPFLTFAQSSKNCAALEALLSDKKVGKCFIMSGITDSFVLIDKDDNFRHCVSVSFGMHSASVIYNDSLSYELKRTPLRVLLGDKCSNFLIRQFRRKGKRYFFDIIQPCSNQGCHGEVRKNRNSYKVVRLDAYVV